MPSPGMRAASGIIVRHPGGSIRVSAPADVPVGELMGDLLELAGLPDHDDWVLGPISEAPYPAERTLTELGVDDGAVLILHDRQRHGSDGSETAATRRVTASTTLGLTGGPRRPLSERNSRLLPVRLSIPARCLRTLGALAREGRFELPTGRGSCASGPAGSTGGGVHQDSATLIARRPLHPAALASLRAPAAKPEL